MRSGPIGAHQRSQLPDEEHRGGEPERPREIRVSVRTLTPIREHLLDIDIGEVLRRHIITAAGALEIGKPHVGGHGLELFGIRYGHRRLARTGLRDVFGLIIRSGGLPDLEFAHVSALGRPVAENGPTIDHSTQLTPRHPGRLGLGGAHAVVRGLPVGQDVDDPGRLGSVLRTGLQILSELRQGALQG